MTDLHTHILPGIDDGADCLELSLKMLRKLKTKGVKRVALTPHFYPMREELSVFLRRRAQAYDILLSAWDKQTMPQLLLGAEVHYTPELLQMDLRQLTIGAGSYLLLELPDADVNPFVEQVVDAILLDGIIPILAHVERCQPFRKDPERLFRLVRMGALAQISAEALTENKDSFAIACLQNGLAQIVASDAHNLKDRFCAIDTKAARKRVEIINWAEEFARSVWDNAPLPAFAIKPLKKNILGYR